MPRSFASLGQDSAPGHSGRHVSAVTIAAPVAAVGGGLLLLAAIAVVAACLRRARKARQTAPETMRSSFALTPHPTTPSLSTEDSPGWQAIFSDAAMALPELQMPIRPVPCTASTAGMACLQCIGLLIYAATSPHACMGLRLHWQPFVYWIQPMLQQSVHAEAAVLTGYPSSRQQATASCMEQCCRHTAAQRRHRCLCPTCCPLCRYRSRRPPTSCSPSPSHAGGHGRPVSQQP